MLIDIKKKSSELLSCLANSIHEREQQPLPENTFTFRTAELQIVEAWLNELLQEIEL